MSRLRFLAVCAALFILSEGSARAQYRAVPPFAGPYNSWSYGGGMFPYMGMPSTGMPWMNPWGMGMGMSMPMWGMPPWGTGMNPLYPPMTGTWVTSGGRYTNVGFEQYVIRPARTRETQFPAVSYRELRAYEQRNAGTEEEGTATISVRLPTNLAKLTINDKQMTQQGAERMFVTPVLPSGGGTYSFELKATWNDDLGSRTQQKTLQVRAGRSYLVTFPLAESK